MSHAATDSHDSHAHPSEKQYWIVFLVLAIVTGIEIAWSYIGVEGMALVVPLILMMLIKFVLVGAVFMHLYSDFKIFGGSIFTWTFAAGLLFAITVFLIVLATFEFAI